MRKRLQALRIEHRDFDAAIDALTAAGSTDQLQIARLKKRKLALKDQIAIFEDYLLPDRYNETYHLLGDGVAVPVVRHLRKHLLDTVLEANAVARVAKRRRA